MQGGCETHLALQNNTLLLVFEGRHIHDDLHHTVLEPQGRPHSAIDKTKQCSATKTPLDTTRQVLTTMNDAHAAAMDCNLQPLHRN